MSARSHTLLTSVAAAVQRGERVAVVVPTYGTSRAHQRALATEHGLTEEQLAAITWHALSAITGQYATIADLPVYLDDEVVDMGERRVGEAMRVALRATKAATARQAEWQKILFRSQKF